MKQTAIEMNRYHICVKKCCASCQYRDILDEGIRICTRMYLKVPQDFICPKWRMSDGMKNAGMSGGVVKKLTEIFLR